MVYEFKSAITRGGGILTPELIIITDDSVTWKRRNNWLIGVDSITIPLGKVSSIEIDDKVWGVNISISSIGNGKIVGKNFTGSDAKKIKKLIEQH